MEKAQEIIHFWFDKTSPEQYFTKDLDLDMRIKERFETVYWDIVKGKTADWRTSPEGRLAEIIALDQFARNMFRDDKQAFAADNLALSLAEEAVAVSADKEVSYEQQVFFYMPYMHSELKSVHEKAEELFFSYGSASHLEFERKHKAVLDQFGRYPHRNDTLGRVSTPEEIKWLASGGGF